MKLSLEQQAYFALVKADFGVFIRQAFATIYPDQIFHDNWHIDAITHVLEQNLAGVKRRLIINLPPRHLKSFLVSVAWPAFLLTRNPSLKIFCVSYSEELAKTIARDFNRLVESPWYRVLFAQVRPIKSTESEFVTEQGGFRLALSMRGSITGRGADLIIIDDPCRPEDAVSDRARTAVNEWFRTTLLTRLDDKRMGGLILVMQRLHVNDLTGFIENSGDFHKLSFPAIAKQDEVIELRNGRIYQRRAGEALQPQREDLEELNKLRDQVSAFHFETQYQQSPRTPDGHLFKRKYFTTDEHTPRLTRTAQYFLSIDSALSTSSSADFTAICVVCIDAGQLYVLYVDRGRWDYEKLKARVLQWIARLTRNNRRLTVLVELAGSGISLGQFLESARYGGFQLLGGRPKEDKYSRASRVLPWFEQGITLVSVPGRNAWVEPFLNEFMCFPNGANDDQVDSLVQLLFRREVLCLLKRPGFGDDFYGSA